ncbi:hypothetical protein DL96DRAFT_915283 [Flagelloscypha sp. PMI_526]|nr:hypothetical protein DL96DRAFT_915283 [Flagelloscypha sp. PMI_526]
MADLASDPSSHRVTFDSYKDYDRVISNVRKFAIAKLGENTKSGKGRENSAALNTQLNKLLDEAVKKLRPNLRVNGRDLDDFMDDDSELALQDGIQAYDMALSTKVEALSNEKLEWQRKVALMRREAPLEIQAQFEKLFEEERALALEEAELEIELLGLERQDIEETMDPDPEWVASAAHKLRQVSALSTQLAQDIPTQEERSREAAAATIEVKGLKP